ncbi:MAG: bifunctional 5,10-methylene-tetrahydrofolate dehydrogenase/5,10-methylene-tetrahydrofolate cyclohydrolase, partial [Bacteroidia bacterium]|nr:bifunctional 5,10-methylene-tetrahydrofolate dehydrogenase/5,10-methylene-tetrahydrofolate cyclohydrolase [Bacteroidia bacterium]
MYTIIDGKKTASDIKHEIADEVKKMLGRGLKVPHLAAILVGDNPSSQ